MEKNKEAGFGMVPFLIVASVLAVLLLGISQVTVSVKDVQKVQVGKLSFIQKMRELNDVLDRPAACRCVFDGLDLRNITPGMLKDVRIYSSPDCSQSLKEVLSNGSNFDGVTYSLELAKARDTVKGEMLVEIEVKGKMNSAHSKKDLHFARTIRLAVDDSSGLRKITACRQ